MKIYNDFNEIADNFDTLFVDAYGVFWGGSAVIPNSLETMAGQVSQGKQVCIVSNTSIVGDEIIDSYQRKGLTKGIHYTDVVTSGDVCLDYLNNGKIPLKGNKFYIIGSMELDIVKKSLYQQVFTPEQSDFVFFGMPQMTLEEMGQYTEFKNMFFRVDENSDNYDLSIITPFDAILKKCATLGLMAVSTNPDELVLERHAGSSTPDWVIRQGSLTKRYREFGGKVVEFGKPYAEIYQYAFQKLKLKPSNRIAMIGDTYRTDILGALNSGITPVWCIDNGLARYGLDHGQSLLEQANGSLKGIYIIHYL